MGGDVSDECLPCKGVMGLIEGGGQSPLLLLWIMAIQWKEDHTKRCGLFFTLIAKGSFLMSATYRGHDFKKTKWDKGLRALSISCKYLNGFFDELTYWIPCGNFIK
jgi:hypothetical protein